MSQNELSLNFFFPYPPPVHSYIGLLFALPQHILKFASLSLHPFPSHFIASMSLHQTWEKSNFLPWLQGNPFPLLRSHLLTPSPLNYPSSIWTFMLSLKLCDCIPTPGPLYWPFSLLGMTQHIAGFCYSDVTWFRCHCFREWSLIT